MSSNDPWASLPNLSGARAVDGQSTLVEDPSRVYPSGRSGVVDSVVARMMDVPRAFVARSSAHNVGTGGGVTTIQWNTRNQDNDGMWGSTIPTRLTIKTPGEYEIVSWILWPANATSYRQIYLLLNGGLYACKTEQPNTVPTVYSQEITRLIQLDAGDYIETGAAQNTGGTLTLPATGATCEWDHGCQVCLTSYVSGDNQ